MPATHPSRIAYEAKLEAAGIRRVTLRLSEGARDRLAELAKIHGSKDKAVEALLLTPPETPAKPPPKPKVVKPKKAASKPEKRPRGWDSDGNELY